MNTASNPNRYYVNPTGYIVDSESRSVIARISPQHLKSRSPAIILTELNAGEIPVTDVLDSWSNCLDAIIGDNVSVHFVDSQLEDELGYIPLYVGVYECGECDGNNWNFVGVLGSGHIFGPDCQEFPFPDNIISIGELHAPVTRTIIAAVIWRMFPNTISGEFLLVLSDTPNLPHIYSYNLQNGKEHVKV